MTPKEQAKEIEKIALFVGGNVGESQIEYGKLLSQAFLSAIQSIEARLPEELGEENNTGAYAMSDNTVATFAEMVGFNTCLSSIKSLLAEVKKEIV